MDDDECLKADALDEANNKINNSNGALWLISQVVSFDKKKNLLKVKKPKSTYDYIQDYLSRSCLAGDALHFINQDLILNNNIRFDSSIKSGGEWRFYTQLSSFTHITYFEKSVKYADYLVDGLTHQNKSNLRFQQNETQAVFNTLMENNVGFKKAGRYARAHIKACCRAGQFAKGFFYIGDLKKIAFYHKLGLIFVWTKYALKYNITKLH